MDGCETDELARWLGSPQLRWVRRSRLALAVADRGEALLRDQRTDASDDTRVGAALLAEWDRALLVVVDPPGVGGQTPESTSQGVLPCDRSTAKPGEPSAVHRRRGISAASRTPTVVVPESHDGLAS